MPSTLPDGDPAPADGSLPAASLARWGQRPFGVYLHVPFCASRCGYCDFNTYTASELGGRTDPAAYLVAARRELTLARRVLGDGVVPASTVFVGGGTPTLLGAAGLTELLAEVRATFGLDDGAEVTTEANPESVDPALLAGLLEAGFTRISFGMQSAAEHVLAVLDRRHTPGRALDAVREARAAGFEHINLDLIYGTPGETIADWRASLDMAIAQRPDHVSAYALIVEDGTKLARQIRRGEIATPDDDLQADMYELADARLVEAGFGWYEVSNWALGAEGAPALEWDRFASRHNLAYWQGHDWWGIGPGAHSHIGGVRWWNVKHPAAYAERMLAGQSPATGRETLDPETRRVEGVLLRSRIREGLPVTTLTAAGRAAVAGLIAEELVDARAAFGGSIQLTLKGRLLADLVVRRLLDE